MDKLTEAYYAVISEEVKIPDIIAGLKKDFVMDKMDLSKYFLSIKFHYLSFYFSEYFGTNVYFTNCIK